MSNFFDVMTCHSVTVWEIITQKVPWDGVPVMEVALRVINNEDRLIIPPDTPVWLAKLMKSMNLFVISQFTNMHSLILYYRYVYDRLYEL